MTTALIPHPACLLHVTPPGHPERMARLQEVLKILDGEDFRTLQRKEAPKATREALARVHDADYVEEILAVIPQSGYVQIDSDTTVSPGSGEAILRAAGALVQGVDMVIGGEVKNAFCAVRPPGHHATRSHALGF